MKLFSSLLLIVGVTGLAFQNKEASSRRDLLHQISVGGIIGAASLFLPEESLASGGATAGRYT